MQATQPLMILAIICIAASALLARRQLAERAGLRWIFGGLLLSDLMGALMTGLHPLAATRVFSIPMLTGMAMVVRGIALEKSSNADPAKS